MGYTVNMAAIFGAGRQGLAADVSYRLMNSDGSWNGAAVTAGIIETSPGTYAASVTFPDRFRGYIVWTLTGVTNIVLSEPVNPEALELVALLAAGVGPYQIDVTLQTSAPAPVQGLQVILWNQAMTLQRGWGISDSAGQVHFGVEPGTYKLAVMTSPGYQTPGTQTIIVTNANLAPVYTLTAQSYPAPGSALLCRVFGRVVNLKGKAVSGVKVEFRLSANTPAEVPTANAFLDFSAVVITTDGDGEFYDPNDDPPHKGVDLLRSSEIEEWTASAGVKYKVIAESLGIAAQNTITMPDANTLDMVLTLPV